MRKGTLNERATAEAEENNLLNMIIHIYINIYIYIYIIIYTTKYNTWGIALEVIS